MAMNNSNERKGREMEIEIEWERLCLMSMEERLCFAVFVADLNVSCNLHVVVLDVQCMHMYSDSYLLPLFLYTFHISELKLSHNAMNEFE